MRRWGLAALALALGLWLAWPPGALPARFALADCHRQVLRDAATGAEILGAEDIALAPGGDLIVAARDRLGAGPAGLWRVADLDTGAARRIAGLEGVAPQGIALAGDRLAVIDRAGPGIRIGVLRAAFAEAARITDPALCRANDLMFQGDELWVTLDRADCGVSLADLLPWGATGRLVEVGAGGIRLLRGDLAFANGLAETDGAVWVAETRGAALTAPGRRLDLPGGPDNLSPSGSGLLAALHPDLLRLALYRGGWTGHAPSRIVEITGDKVALLVDDPGGTVFSAATVAVWVGGRLVAGSVRDTGLMVCGT